MSEFVTGIGAGMLIGMGVMKTLILICNRRQKRKP